jgi:hypothetical protein
MAAPVYKNVIKNRTSYRGRLSRLPTHAHVHLPPCAYRFAYLLPQAPSGFRRAVVLLRGRQASGGSEGPLGAKLASAELMLLSGRQVEDWGEVSGWVTRRG